MSCIWEPHTKHSGIAPEKWIKYWLA